MLELACLLWRRIISVAVVGNDTLILQFSKFVISCSLYTCGETLQASRLVAEYEVS